MTQASDAGHTEIYVKSEQGQKDTIHMKLTLPFDLKGLVDAMAMYYYRKGQRYD